jgi:hypothetical protein
MPAGYIERPLRLSNVHALGTLRTSRISRDSSRRLSDHYTPRKNNYWTQDPGRC